LQKKSVLQLQDALELLDCFGAEERLEQEQQVLQVLQALLEQAQVQVQVQAQVPLAQVLQGLLGRLGALVRQVHSGGEVGLPCSVHYPLGFSLLPPPADARE
jgi:hypothetical protein